ncbi:type II toxin-antitoxin system VapB family antitoxin [Caulobacter sp. BK020]|uniref:type II toxin-antitoxin system VapB family antitoxin n=1 Tax=Caulobacter sp. BK020 TaxID=2512117 RepID=UPI0010495F5D|nr:type II toxin-antitoxin system VapB family antitoxin [Caulobacter sp. BK020]TCS18104.1 antitoxin VapB [Caulobacter sp. BK020]
MGIFIKNPETEKAVREIAALRGETITGVIDALAREALARETPAPRKRRPTLEEMMAATEEFRRAVGLDKHKLNVTKADFDELNEIPGLELRDDAP